MAAVKIHLKTHIKALASGCMFLVPTQSLWPGGRRTKQQVSLELASTFLQTGGRKLMVRLAPTLTDPRSLGLLMPQQTSLLEHRPQKSRSLLAFYLKLKETGFRPAGPWPPELRGPTSPPEA